MKKSKEIEADFEVDKLTNSIENTITCEVFETVGAKQFGGGNRMFIDTKESLALVRQYFKDFEYGKL